MLFIKPHFVALLGLCVVASMSTAVSNRETGVVLKRASPADPITNAIAPVLPGDKNKDSGDKGSDDKGSNGRDSVNNGPKNSESMDKDAKDRASDKPTDKSKSRRSTTMSRKTRLGENTGSYLHKRNSHYVYPRGYSSRNDRNGWHRHHHKQPWNRNKNWGNKHSHTHTHIHNHGNRQHWY